MKKQKLIIALIWECVLLFSCGNNASAQEVKIGTQIWATKNLDVSTFRNGDTIPEAKTKEEWAKAGEDGKPAWCYYNNDPANGKKYGKPYNWYAVNDPRGLAPKGWHGIECWSAREFKQVFNYADHFVDINKLV